MKMTCPLCGGKLRKNLIGRKSTCRDCGMTYPAGQQGEKPIKPVQQVVFGPRQFVMDINGKGKGDLSGYVRQSGIGIGDNVYIDGDYGHPYRIYAIGQNFDMSCVKQGMQAELFLVKCPGRILKNARIVTGAPDQVSNAYNFPGTVGEYFAALLSDAFDEYEIRTGVACDGLKIPVNFMLCRDAQPVLAILLFDSNDSKARYQARKAVDIFAPEGISSIHFFENYRNDAPYVIDRVRTALGKRPN